MAREHAGGTYSAMADPEDLKAVGKSHYKSGKARRKPSKKFAQTERPPPPSLHGNEWRYEEDGETDEAAMEAWEEGWEAGIDDLLEQTIPVSLQAQRRATFSSPSCVESKMFKDVKEAIKRNILAGRRFGQEGLAGFWDSIAETESTGNEIPSGMLSTLEDLLEWDSSLAARLLDTVSTTLLLGVLRYAGSHALFFFFFVSINFFSFTVTRDAWKECFFSFLTWSAFCLDRGRCNCVGGGTKQR